MLNRLKDYTIPKLEDIVQDLKLLYLDIVHLGLRFSKLIADVFGLVVEVDWYRVKVESYLKKLRKKLK